MSDGATTTETIAPVATENVAPTTTDTTVRVSPIQRVREQRAARKSPTQEPLRMSNEQKNAPAAPPPAAAPAQPTQVVSPEILAELSALRAERDARAKADEEAKAAFAKLQETLTMTAKEKAAIEEQNRSIKISTAVRLAAMEHALPDAVDDVTELLSKRFTLDESGAVVANDETKAKVHDVIKSYLEKKPYLAARKVAGGSGASPFPAQSAPSSQSLDLSTAEGMTRFARGIR